MGISVATSPSAIDHSIDEAWRFTINCKAGQAPQMTVFNHIVDYDVDGNIVGFTDGSENDPNFVKQFNVFQVDVLDRTDDLTFTDKDGTSHTIPTHALPSLQKAMIDLFKTEARQARADYLAAQAAEQE